MSTGSQPPLAYRSTASTPSLPPLPRLPQNQRRSASSFTSTALTTDDSGTIDSHSSYRSSTRSFDFSTSSRSTHASSPLSTLDRDYERIVGTIREMEGKEDEGPNGVDFEGDSETGGGESPVDPGQAQPSSPRSYYAVKTTAHPSPYGPSMDARVPYTMTPSGPTRMAFSGLTLPVSPCPYPMDYGEPSWSCIRALRDGRGVGEKEIPVVSPASRRNERSGQQAGGASTISSNPLSEPTSKMIEQALPSLDILAPPTVALHVDEPFLPTSPVVMSKLPSAIATTSHVSRPAIPTDYSFLSSPACTSSTTMTPTSLALNPNPSRVSCGSRRTSNVPNCTVVPKKIWSARTNRYIYINTSTLSTPVSSSLERPSRLARGLMGSKSVPNLPLPSIQNRANDETGSSGGGQESIAQLSRLPYFTRAPNTREKESLDIHLLNRGEARLRN